MLQLRSAILEFAPATRMTLSKLCIGFLDNNQVGLFHDLSEFHSAKVNPRTLTVSIQFFQVLGTEEALKKCPQLRLYLIQSQYSGEKTKAQSLGPDVAQFFDITMIASLCKHHDQVAELETFSERANTYLEMLNKTLNRTTSNLEFPVFADLVLRCKFAKPWPDLQPLCKLKLGQFSEDKVQDLTIYWATYLDLK